MSEGLKAVIESLLFVAGEPLTLKRIQDALELPEPDPIRPALADLAADYEARGGGFYLDEVAGGYQLRTRPAHRDAVRRLLSAGSARLSPAALETLAIIAYRQPVMRADIDHVRGVDSGGVLRALLERRLIRVLGRKEIPGRPLIYGTTRQFLEVFGLRDLKDLPTLKEIAAMGEAEDDSAGDSGAEAAAAVDGAADVAPAPAEGEDGPADGESDSQGDEEEESSSEDGESGALESGDALPEDRDGSAEAEDSEGEMAPHPVEGNAGVSDVSPASEGDEAARSQSENGESGPEESMDSPQGDPDETAAAEEENEPGSKLESDGEPSGETPAQTTPETDGADGNADPDGKDGISAPGAEKSPESEADPEDEVSDPGEPESDGKNT